MKTYKEFISEGKKLTIFHGDNFNTKKLDPKKMNKGNNQEGIGIYFSNIIETAKEYGKNVISIEVDKSKLIPSRGYIGGEIDANKIAKILKAMYEVDNEEMYYYMTDYVEIIEPEDIEDYHFEELANNVRGEQVRNFQIDLANTFGVVNFIKAWNKFTDIDGTYEKQRDNEIWYAISNPKIKVKQIK